MSAGDKPLVWLHGEVKTPPFSAGARIEAGYLLRLLQKGGKLSMPQSRPLPVIGRACHELRIKDAGADWRIYYRIDGDAVVIAEVAEKRTRATPDAIIGICRQRLKAYDQTVG